MEEIFSPLFRGVERSETEEMKSAGCLRQAGFSRGDIIFHRGDRVSELGIVLSGSVHIESVDVLGSRSILNNTAPGQVFAETYALCGEPMMVDAVAAEDCKILFLRAEAITADAFAAASWQGKLLHNILRASVQKNLALSDRIFCTTPKTVRARVLTYLSGQAVKSGGNTFRIPFDRQQLADYLNLDRSALSKELGKMRDEGILEFYKNSFRLLR